MPFINIKSVGQLSKEQKARIAQEVTEIMERIAHKPPQYTYVVFEEVERENWAIGGELLSS